MIQPINQIPFNKRFKLNNPLEYQKPLDILNLPNSIENILYRNNIYTLDQLMQHSVSSLLDIPKIGESRAFDIVYALQKHQEITNQ